jgi:tRNA U34 5-methylaminomethyl-2-thiouridine-forming methyltransferase MnmC
MDSINDQIIITKDGSNSLKSRFLNEQYHSKQGAITEAIHVYIVSGLNQIQKPNISILEMGFGTGLNTFLTYCFSNNYTKVEFDSIESEPISIETANQLNYLSVLDKLDLKPVFDKLHSYEWNKQLMISDNFYFTKWNTTIQEISFNKKYDLVYYDAFGPRVQPELWKPEIFAKIYDSLNDGGILVTYCANGQFKRDLASVGFEVKSIPGPPGKREITQAFCKK